MSQRYNPMWFAGLIHTLSAGCASVVAHHGQPPGTMSGAPSGLYAMTLHTSETGSMTAIIAAEPTSSGFRANSRPGAVTEVVGGLEGVLATLFGGPAFAGGAFLHWQGEVETGSPSRGRLTTPLGAFCTDVYALDRPIELRTAAGHLAGFMTLEPATNSEAPATNYAELVDRIDAALQTHLYDPSMYGSTSAEAFLRRLRRLTTIARDDAEFAFGFFVAKRRLDFSHLYLLKRLEPAFEARLSTTAASMGSKAVMLQNDRDVATLRIASFDGLGDQVDAAFAEIARSQPRALIIDLRDNTGGDYSSLRVATHLLERPADAGVLFRRRARRDVLAGGLDRFPRISNVATVEQLRRLMVEHGAVVGRVEPADQGYAGQVAVLINRRTASACEPLVALLQGVGRAMLVGERTAGAMLSSEAFEVGQGWVLYLPVSDFLTADGRRLEGRGVPPDVKCNSSDAPLVARRLLEAAITSEVR